tara:strand:- start:837 stop:1418 length:582 start_codon:yes stop_codon:yes gene_type:complete
MSNQAYLQGVAEALSQMNVDPQIKVASYNELEKIAGVVPQGVIDALAKVKALPGHALAGAQALPGKALAKGKALRASGKAGIEGLAGKVPAALGGDTGRLGQALTRRAQGISDTLMGLGVAGVGTGVGLGLNAALDDSDEIAAAEALAAEQAAAEALAAEQQADSDRKRNLALALGGTALAGGLGYGAYKAMS